MINNKKIFSSIFKRFYETNINLVKPGQVIKKDGKPFILVSKDHGGTGRSAAVFTVKNPITGQKVQFRAKGGESVQVMELRQRPYQYLYTSGKEVYLMNMQNYEELKIGTDKLEGGASKLGLLEDGMEVTVQILEPEPGPISWRLPARHVYTIESVVRRALQAKGSTYNPAIINGGAEVKVPDFVSPGDKVVIDTDTLEYVSKA
ncbi:hypothetical protein BB559_000223 [Furculomyces boomerangus]|uniref:Elongation factor P n=1 Tax=Furculomyces boomerangus TaxID=61424 RepID=A0A2T9Z5Y6_9FUNG|nr:hypothetical protein BB559_000223 [Furculomyces boomerangus]